MIVKPRPAGTQSIARTIAVLKTVAARKEIGWRLTDLAAHCQLDNATTYRILACLTSERLVQQRSRDRRYVAGPLLFELALALPAYAAFKAAVHLDLVNTARRLKGIAFLYLRSGDESVCIDRVGSAPVQPLTVIGTRRPMAESTGGIAMLLQLPKSEQTALIAAAARQPSPATERRTSSYRTILQRSRRYGFGVTHGDLVPGLSGFAIAIMNKSSRPIASIGFMGPSAFFAGDRLAKLAKSLQEDARRIEQEQAEFIADLGDQEQPLS